MKIFEISIICILAVSFVANVCYVIFNRPMGIYTYRWDLFRWISSYQLFAETPRCFKLYYRDRSNQDNEMTGWRELPLIAPRRWYHLFLYPEKLVADNVYSFIDDIVKLEELKTDPADIYGSFQFQTLQRFVRRFPPVEGAVGRQFRIDEVPGYFSEKKDMRTMFISRFHDK